MSAVLNLSEGLPRLLGEKKVRIVYGSIVNFCLLVDEKNPIHRDKEAAQKAGFRDIIAPGVMITSLVSGFIAEHYPLGILRELVAGFSEPVCHGDEATIALSLSDWTERAGIKIFSLGFFVRNQGGKEILSGSARVVYKAKKA